MNGKAKLTALKIRAITLPKNIQRIYNHLLLNTFYLSDYGLYRGKTGCLLFLAHYAQQHEGDINDEVVSELIDGIFSAVPKIPSLCMQQGICGIGWGVEYILQNQLLEGCSDETLGDLDALILKKEAKTIANSLHCADVLRYIAVRLTSSCAVTSALPFPPNYLLELCRLIENGTQPVDAAMQSDVAVIKKSVEEGRFSLPPIHLTDEMIGKVPIAQFPVVGLGLHNGLSGLGVKLLLDNQNREV